MGEYECYVCELKILGTGTNVSMANWWFQGFMYTSSLSLRENSVWQKLAVHEERRKRNVCLASLERALAGRRTYVHMLR